MSLTLAGVASMSSTVSVPDLLRLRDDTALPRYEQLFQQLVALIEGGRLAPGVTLPAERQLAQRLGVSRTTVQRCYSELRKLKLVDAFGRRGFIVQPPPRVSTGMDRLKGFTEEARELGMVPSARILEQTVLSDRSVASIFGRPSNARFLKLVRVRYGDDNPMSYETAWYDLAVAPGLLEGDLSQSVYQWLAQHCGVPLAYCEQTVEAAAPNARECTVFSFAEPLPCLLIKRRSYTRSDQMVEYVEGLFRGDTYTYRLRLSI